MALSDVQQTLINYEIYEDGTRLLGSGTVTLPEINFVTSEITGAGIAGKLEMPVLGMLEALELTIQWRTLFVHPLTLMKQHAHMLSFRGAVQTYDAAQGVIKVLPIRIDARCHPKGMSPGKMEMGEHMETESKFAATYIKITENDRNTVLEYDVFNYVYVVDGVDFMTEVRSALGL